MRSVAGAVISSEVTRVGDGDATWEIGPGYEDEEIRGKGEELFPNPT